ESELYDDVCDRLRATNDGQRACAIELALEGLYLARKISKDTAAGEAVYGGKATARPRRGAGCHGAGRQGRLLPRGGDGGVPPRGRSRPDRPGRPGPPGRRA